MRDRHRHTDRERGREREKERDGKGEGPDRNEFSLLSPGTYKDVIFKRDWGHTSKKLITVSLLNGHQGSRP